MTNAARSLLTIVLLAAAPAAYAQAPAATTTNETIREIEITVDRAYAPSRIELKAGERVRLKFVRKDWSPCAAEVVIPALGIRQALPVNEPTTIELPALAPGEYEFHCGMKMLRGTIVAA